VDTRYFCGQIVAIASKILPGKPRKAAGITLTEIPGKIGEITQEGRTSVPAKISVAPMMDWIDDLNSFCRINVLSLH
jgi:hypothetical protein